MGDVNHSSHGWRQTAKRAKCNTGKIGAYRKVVILLRDAQGSLAQIADIDQVSHIAVSQGDIRHLDCDLGAAGTHGDTYVRLGQRQGVVHTVTHHDQGIALPAQLFQYPGLVLRQQSCVTGIQAELTTEPFCHWLFVAGEQIDALDARRTQVIDNLPGARAQPMS